MKNLPNVKELKEQDRLERRWDVVVLILKDESDNYNVNEIW